MAMMIEEILNGKVTRVMKRSGVSPFPQRPKIEDFVPSSEEKQQAAEGGPLLISVLHDIEPATCLAHRLLTPATGICFDLKVSEVREIQAENKSRWLRVWRDPLPHPYCLLPGADGHAGISGLEKPDGEDRKIRKALLSALVDIAVASFTLPASPAPSTASE